MVAGVQLDLAAGVVQCLLQLPAFLPGARQGVERVQGLAHPLATETGHEPSQPRWHETQGMLVTIAPIAAEELIGALTAEHHCDVAPCELGHQVGRQQGRVEDRASDPESP